MAAAAIGKYEGEEDALLARSLGLLGVYIVVSLLTSLLPRNPVLKEYAAWLEEDFNYASAEASVR